LYHEVAPTNEEIEFVETTSDSRKNTSDCSSVISEDMKNTFSALLSQQPQETLSYVLFLALDCLCQQLPTVGSLGNEIDRPAGQQPSLSFRQQFIYNNLKSNIDFVQVLHELAHHYNPTTCDPGKKIDCRYHTFQMNEVYSYANQLWTAIMV